MDFNVGTVQALSELALKAEVRKQKLGDRDAGLCFTVDFGDTANTINVYQCDPAVEERWFMFEMMWYMDVLFALVG